MDRSVRSFEYTDAVCYGLEWTAAVTFLSDVLLFWTGSGSSGVLYRCPAVGHTPPHCCVAATALNIPIQAPNSHRMVDKRGATNKRRLPTMTPTIPAVATIGSSLGHAFWLVSLSPAAIPLYRIHAHHILPYIVVCVPAVHATPGSCVCLFPHPFPPTRRSSTPPPLLNRPHATTLPL